MSLLLAHGHPEAMHYPIGMVWDEAQLIAERLNGQMAGIGILIQAATATTGMGANRQVNAEFRKLIEGLTEG